jgi:hypothetical protein
VGAPSPDFSAAPGHGSTVKETGSSGICVGYGTAAGPGKGAGPGRKVRRRNRRHQRDCLRRVSGGYESPTSRRRPRPRRFRRLMSLKHPTSGRWWSASRRSDVGCHRSIERPVDIGSRPDSDVGDAAADHASARRAMIDLRASSTRLVTPRRQLTRLGVSRIPARPATDRLCGRDPRQTGKNRLRKKPVLGDPSVLLGGASATESVIRSFPGARMQKGATAFRPSRPSPQFVAGACVT